MELKRETPPEVSLALLVVRDVRSEDVIHPNSNSGAARLDVVSIPTSRVDRWWIAREGLFRPRSVFRDASPRTGRRE